MENIDNVSAEVTCASQALGGIEFGLLRHSSLQSPATPVRSHIVYFAFKAFELTFVLGLSVDENPLKLQLLLELLEVRQLHIRAGRAEKSNS